MMILNLLPYSNESGGSGLKNKISNPPNSLKFFFIINFNVYIKFDNNLITCFYILLLNIKYKNNILKNGEKWKVGTKMKKGN